VVGHLVEINSKMDAIHGNKFLAAAIMYGAALGRAGTFFLENEPSLRKTPAVDPELMIAHPARHGGPLRPSC
jgi:hypothetical protein